VRFTARELPPRAAAGVVADRGHRVGADGGGGCSPGSGSGRVCGVQRGGRRRSPRRLNAWRAPRALRQPTLRRAALVEAVHRRIVCDAVAQLEMLLRKCVRARACVSVRMRVRACVRVQSRECACVRAFMCVRMRAYACVRACVRMRCARASSTGLTLPAVPSLPRGGVECPAGSTPPLDGNAAPEFRPLASRRSYTDGAPMMQLHGSS
jgi:hypothetical protein